MSLLDPQPKLTPIQAEEDDEIQAHGMLKVFEGSLSQFEVEGEGEGEGEVEGEGDYDDDDEDEVDDDEDEVDDDDDDEDDVGDDDDDDDEDEGEVDDDDDEIAGEAEEEFELCGVCLKDKEHCTFDCPFLVRIPNPMEVTLGPGYDLLCAQCNELGHCDKSQSKCVYWGGKSEGKWDGRATMKLCYLCQDVLHSAEECPKKDTLALKSMSECSARYRARLAIEKCQAAGI